MEDIVRLILFTLAWTAIWVAPLPRLGMWAELVAGLVPFTAFGLRVFAGFFVGVPDEDPVRSAVSPLLDWINGRAGFPPYAWVLDATIALGLVWLASTFDIPRRSRIATAGIMPAVAVLALVSLGLYGLPIERFLAASIPGPFLGLAVGSVIGGVIRWTPSPIPEDLRRRAAVLAILTVPALVVVGTGALRLISGLPPEQASQTESIVALVAGAGAALAGWAWGGFVRPRSRFLFAMAVGVSAGAVVALLASSNPASLPARNHADGPRRCRSRTIPPVLVPGICDSLVRSIPVNTLSYTSFLGGRHGHGYHVFSG